VSNKVSAEPRVEVYLLGASVPMSRNPTTARRQHSNAGLAVSACCRAVCTVYRHTQHASSTGCLLSGPPRTRARALTQPGVLTTSGAPAAAPRSQAASERAAAAYASGSAAGDASPTKRACSGSRWRRCGGPSSGAVSRCADSRPVRARSCPQVGKYHTHLNLFMPVLLTMATQGHPGAAPCTGGGGVRSSRAASWCADGGPARVSCRALGGRGQGRDRGTAVKPGRTGTADPARRAGARANGGRACSARPRCSGTRLIRAPHMCCLHLAR